MITLEMFFFRGQLKIEDDTSDSDAKLRIKNIKTSDEGEYKCEITFLDITKNCPVVQLVKLTTLGKLHSHSNIKIYYFEFIIRRYFTKHS